MSFLKKVPLLCIISLIGCGMKPPSPAFQIDGCALDSVDGASPLENSKFITQKNQSIAFNGWMADPVLGSVPNQIFVYLISQNGTPYAFGNGAPAGSRPDVALAYSKNDIEKSGYTISGKTVDIPVGSYDIILNGRYQNKIGVCKVAPKLEVFE